MGDRAHSIAEYRRLIEAYRRLGPDHASVAREMGMDRRAAIKVYNQGWKATKVTPLYRPVKDVLAEMKAAEPPVVVPPELSPPVEPLPDPEKLPEPKASAVNPETPTEALVATGQILPPGVLIDKEMYLEPDELQRHAVKSLRNILNGIDIARNGITGIAASATRLVGAYQPLLAKVKKDLEMQVASENIGPHAAEDAVKTLTALNGALNGSAAAMKTLVEAEKLALGAPTSIIGLITPAPAKVATVETDQQTENNRVLQALFALGADPGKATAPEQKEYEPETGGADNKGGEDDE